MDNCRRMECSLVACPKDKLREAVRAEIEKNEKHGKLNRSNTAWQIELDIAKETDGEDDDDDDTMDESNEYMQVDADMFDFNLRLTFFLLIDKKSVQSGSGSRRR